MQGLLWIKRNANILFFVGGFIFDSVTMVRIDSTVDLLIQLSYLGAITFFMIAQARLTQGRWTPQGWIARAWAYETEIIHFCYGGLLSGFVVFYFKSTSLSRSLTFFVLMAALMVMNEMPQVPRWGENSASGCTRSAWCPISTTCFPVLIRRMGWPRFPVGVDAPGRGPLLCFKGVARYPKNPPQASRPLGKAPPTFRP